LMLEELIGESDGGFLKYINNTEAVPLSTMDTQRKERGDFLAFTQHVQYNKTMNLAFVSDQQGRSKAFLVGVILLIPLSSRRPLTSHRPPDHHIAVSFNFLHSYMLKSQLPEPSHRSDCLRMGTFQVLLNTSHTSTNATNFATITVLRNFNYR
jgi:hypothetical protein